MFRLTKSFSAAAFQTGSLCAAALLACSPSFCLADSVTVSSTETQLSASAFQYTYHVSGSLNAGDDLAIYFPYGTTGQITDLTLSSGDVATFVLQADQNLPADGEYDIVANVANPAFSSAFSLGFNYTGNGTPGPQNFSVYDSDFNQIATGTTEMSSSNSPVPEPGSLLLIGSGTLGLCFGRPRRHG